MIGCAVDSWWLNKRVHSPQAWRTDPRMSLVSAAGHTFRILDNGASGPAVLFAADAPVVLEHYAPHLDTLAGGRRAIAIEMPGFGFSTPAMSYRFTLDEQAGALLALLDALHLDRVTLAFTCINALVALAFAHRHPDRVDRLMLSQIPSAEEFAKWSTRIDMRVLGVSVLRIPVVGQAVMLGAASSVADRWFSAALSQKSDSRAFAMVSREVYQSGGAFCLAALTQALRGVRSEDVGMPSVPTTILWGDADRTHRKTDKASSNRWHSAAQVVHWDSAGHCPDLEEPEEFARLL